jgi:hypothetical protein
MLTLQRFSNADAQHAKFFGQATPSLISAIVPLCSRVICIALFPKLVAPPYESMVSKNGNQTMRSLACYLINRRPTADFVTGILSFWTFFEKSPKMCRLSQSESDRAASEECKKHVTS